MTISAVQAHIERFLAFFDVTGTVVVQDVLGQTVFAITTEDSKKVVGRNGEVLRALNYLVHKIAEKEQLETTWTIDINGQRAKKVAELEDTAKLLAERARSFKYDVAMAPMNAYERLVVHTVLQDEKDVTTESQGEGADRHLVIKYTG